MIPSAELRKRIVRDYDANPIGWQVFTARDREGHQDTIFVHGEDLFAIKEHIVNPFESVGFGTSEKIEPWKSPLIGPSFGLRTVTWETLQMILQAGEGALGRGLLGEILNQNPVSTGLVTAPVLLQGPVNYSTSPLNLLGRGQSDIEIQLRNELDKLIERRYPHLKNMYR